MYPGMRFDDARAALRWMTDVLGAEEVLVVDGELGIRHGEVRIAGGILMFGDGRGEDDVFARPTGAGHVYIAVDDPDALHDRAVAAGGTILSELAETSYGSRDFALVDPEGNHWYFGTYRP